MTPVVFHRFLISTLTLTLATLAACDADSSAMTDEGQTQSDTIDRVPLGKADAAGTCQGTDGDFCGGKSAGLCWCDDACHDYGDCCGDVGAVCECTPDTCESLGLSCGTADDGCGGTLNCGRCQTDDPFDPASCSGPAMTRSEAVALFAPGTTEVNLGTYVIQQRSRPCNALTGCAPWGETVTRLGSSLGSLGKNMEMRGVVGLDINGDRVQLKLRDKSWQGAGTTCTGVGGDLSCGIYSYVIGTQWGGSGGLYPSWSRVLTARDPGQPNDLRLGGILTNTCVRLTQQVVTSDREEEYVVLARLEAPTTPEESECPAGQNLLQCSGGNSSSTTCCTLGLVTCPQSGCDCWGACS